MDDQGSSIRSIGALGKILNQRYQLIRQIGHGAMGDVFSAHDLRLDRDVAVKVLRETFTGDPILLARFEREAKATGKLSHHPNVVTVFDVDESHNQPFIVMELVTGGTLSSRIHNGPIPVVESIHITDQILSALAFAHEHGIIHRDIKPSNIFISKDNEIKVGDFGIATIYEGSGDSNLTLTSQIIGTPAYLSPERAEGKTSGASSDIFSVGVVLYEMLTGQKPFPNTSPIATIIAAKQGDFTAPELLNPSIPENLCKVIKRSLSANPNDRYSSAQHMAAALLPQDQIDETAVINKRELLIGDETMVGTIAAVPFVNMDNTSSMATTANNDVSPVTPALNPNRERFGAKLVAIVTAIMATFGVMGRWIHSKLPESLRERLDGRYGAFGLIAIAVIAFLLVTLLFFGHGTTPAKNGPTTSFVTTTSAPTTTIPPTTTAPPTTVPPPAPVPQGHGKKGH